MIGRSAYFPRVVYWPLPTRTLSRLPARVIHWVCEKIDACMPPCVCCVQATWAASATRRNLVSWLIDWTDTSLRYNHWRMCFERLLLAFARWQPGILFDIAAQPILEYRWIYSYSQPSLRTYSSKLQLSIRFTPSRCLDVRQDWYPM